LTALAVGGIMLDRAHRTLDARSPRPGCPPCQHDPKGTMYAVIESGGKQYRVELGTELAVDRLDAQPGESIQLDRVLLVADEESAAIGRPALDDARVAVDVLRHDRGDKIVVFKYRPKARHRSKSGARAELTVLRVSDIVHGERSAAKLAEAARTERQRLEAAAAEQAARQAEADKALAAKLAKAAVPAPTETKPTRTSAAKAKAAPATKAKAAPATKAKAAPATKAEAAPATKAKPAAKAKPAKEPEARAQAPDPGVTARRRRTTKDQ
jgi:large subunit ribosomal protein L21